MDLHRDIDCADRNIDLPDLAPAGTSLAKAEARIAELESQLQAAAGKRAELIHLVSHELRNPLTVISGFGRLLQNEAHGSLNENQQHFTEEVLKACRRLDLFVGDLLDAGPGRVTPFSVMRRPADLHDVIEAQLESLGPVLEEKGMRIDSSLAAIGGQLAFDTRRIEQVLTNLLTNAIRYARCGGRVVIETRDLNPGDACYPGVEVAVEDDGPGIPEADRERLFAPYVRGNHPTESGSSGLGIGLAICRRIIEAHGGRIAVRAGTSSGARFVFELSRDVGNVDRESASCAPVKDDADV